MLQRHFVFAGVLAWMKSRFSLSPKVRATMTLEGMKTMLEHHAFRPVVITAALLAVILIIFPRGLQLEGKTLARKMPPETIEAAFITRGETREAAWVDYAVGIDLAEWNLSGTSFRGSTLVDPTLARAALQRAQFQDAYVWNGRFIGADLKEADFSHAILVAQAASTEEEQPSVGDQKNMEGGQSLGPADFSGANLEGAVFDGTNLAGVHFDCANLKGASFRGTTLSGAVFRHANLEGVNFEDVEEVGDADFTEACLNRIDTYNEDNPHINDKFGSAKLGGATMLGADLRGFSVTEEQLRNQGIRFQGASLACSRVSKDASQKGNSECWNAPGPANSALFDCKWQDPFAVPRAECDPAKLLR